VIRITTRDATARVRFRYDVTAVEIMKSVPTRQWDAAAKEWKTETVWIQLLAKRFNAAGFDVEIDGRLWEPPSPKPAIGDPLTVLFRAIPTRLHKPTYSALAKVFHPDVGGDKVLMQQLNQAMKRKK
jgi:hypothetical protein